MSKWIRKGDKVVVIAGNEKGQVSTVLAKKEDRVILQGLNLRKKHVKPKAKMQKGIVEMEAPMHISNVRICDDNGKAIKLKVKVTEEGAKQLIYFDAGQEVFYRDLKKKKD